VYSPYFPPHDTRAVRFKEHCVDNAVGLEWTASGGVGMRRSDRCKAKWMYGTGWSDSKAAVQAEHRLNLARSCETDHRNGYENRSPVFSYERFPKFMHVVCQT